MCPKKLTKCPNFTRFLPEKNSFCPKKGGGAIAPLPPVSYAYGAHIQCILKVHLRHIGWREMLALSMHITKGLHFPENFIPRPHARASTLDPTG